MFFFVLYGFVYVFYVSVLVVDVDSESCGGIVFVCGGLEEVGCGGGGDIGW